MSSVGANAEFSWRKHFDLSTCAAITLKIPIARHILILFLRLKVNLFCKPLQDSPPMAVHLKEA